jgi:ParB family chromosome partitioning protein
MTRDILLSLIDPDPEQPRKHFDQTKLDELAQSIGANGLAVPILVRPTGERFLIVHGERRWRAAKILGWDSIPAEIRDVSTEDARWLSLVENVQRNDLTPIDEARAYKQRLDNGITQSELGARVGKSQSYIAQKMRLLRLPKPLQFYVEHGALTEGHARQIMRIEGMYPKSATEELNEIEDRRLSWSESIGMLNEIRPEDNTPGWILSEKDHPIITEACNVFWRHCVDNQDAFPTWLFAAFWWASWAVWSGASVSVLTKALDGWEERVLTAVWWSGLLNADPPTGTHANARMNRLLWFGYRSDARHARVNINDHSIVNALETLEKSGRLQGQDYAYPVPSCCQPWGTKREEYLELEQQLEQIDV